MAIGTGPDSSGNFVGGTGPDSFGNSLPGSFGNAGRAARLSLMRPARRRLVLFSAALVTLAAVLPAGTASAATVTAAGNRVWAISVPAHDHAGADDLVSADQRLGERRSCPICASGACVAPEAASPLDMVPEGASRRVLTPDPNGGAQEGVEFKWTNEQGQTVRLRIHGPDGTAPPGSNAAEGPIYRVQVGGRYMDAQGNLYPRGVYNPNSPYYDPEAANATHIPWPSDVPLPW
jgi:Bacterial toxin 30